MKYGFVIDNRKCIGCHACTTACKSEHQVPIGVNRTWVKQVEKGTFPDTRRLFSVLRCNHCTDAPCVEICPTESLFIRADGIVDFDKDRCIGCKSCMQACPYDALYIDPETNTAAKCNYCAHRVDIGLEPACVNVCPEEAIISGDMEDPTSNIAQLLARQSVSARKTEKGTQPNLFYIDADEASLNPTATAQTDTYLWSEQTTGVGHFAKQAEKLAFTNTDLIATLLEQEKKQEQLRPAPAPKSVEVLMGKVGKEAKRVYDTPNKGILWGWEVSAYVFTKAIAAGAFLVPFIGVLFGWIEPSHSIALWSFSLGLIFLTVTGLLLIMDLDQPKRFLYVLLRPHWNSWLVKGGYAITIYGGLLTFLLVAQLLGWSWLSFPIKIITAITALIVAVYTAFLFAQAKGRDFWQSPTLSIHMLLHSLLAGGAVFAIINLFSTNVIGLPRFLAYLLIGTILANLTTLFFELTTSHPTSDAERVSKMITRGQYSKSFYGGALLIGNLLPLVLLLIGAGNSMALAASGIFILIGIYFTEHIWVEAPQKIPLT